MTQIDAIEMTIACLSRINMHLELQSMMLLLERIDALEVSQFCNYANGLVQWKSTFTQKFIRDLNAKVNEWMRGDPKFPQMDISTRDLHVSIVSIASFKMFVDLYNTLMLTTKPENHRYMVLFFEFVNKYEFKLEAPPEEVKIDLDKVIEIKNWNGRMKALDGIRDMTYRIGKTMNTIDGIETFKFLFGAVGSLPTIRNNPVLYDIVSRIENTMMTETR